MERVRLWHRYNTIRCVIGLILSVLVIVCVFIGMVMQIGDVITVFGHDAFYPFRKFTMLSNLMVLVSVLLGFPFQIEGLRKKNYNVPQWLLCVQFVTTICILLTFLVCVAGDIFNLNPEFSIFKRGFLFQHFLVPLFTIILFLFVNIDYTVPFGFSVAAIVPVIIYGILYVVQVLLIGEKNGGWIDFYHIKALPKPYILIPLLCVSFIILTELLCRLHNRFHKLVLFRGERFLSAEGTKSVESSVAQLAMIDALERGDTMVLRVPIDVISYMRERYGSDSPIEMLCGIYIDEFLKHRR